MTRATTPEGRRRASWVALLVPALVGGIVGCSKKGHHSKEHAAGDPSASAAASGSAAPSVSTASNTPAPSSSHNPAPETKPRPAQHTPGPTGEAIALEARAHVTEAVKHATGKDACGEILPLLDVSYSLVRTSFPLEEHTLSVFAECAEHAHRWRLLRDVAEAIAAGERKLETTYFLPRAFVGEGDYEKAHGLSKATLRAWPTEGEAYNTGALASLRVKDWEGAVKAADQALLLQRKRGVNDVVTAEAHALRGAAEFHLGKAEEGRVEVDAAKAHEEVCRLAGVMPEAAHVAKEKGLLVSVDVPAEAYPALLHLYEKKAAPLSGLVTVTLQSFADKPMPVTVEVTVAGAEPASQSETVTKGHPLTVVLTPTWKAGSELAAPKAPEVHEVTVNVSGGPEHAALYREERKVTFEPADQMPTFVRTHAEDLRSGFGIEAAWVTPKAPAIVALVEAAKARLKGEKRFEGNEGRSLPQAQALWDEVRSRDVSFHRDPSVDSEATESQTCRLPADILASGSGNALESSVLFASLLESIGLDVVLVRTPGHRMIGWVSTRADLAATEATAVKSPHGQAFFLETTSVGEGPFDAAVLRGDAQWVAATNDGSVSSGRAEGERLSELRKRGVVPRAE